MSFQQTGPGGLGNLGGSKLTLGSLAQSARTKQIKQARTILFVVGVLNLIGGIGLLALIGNLKGAPAANPQVIQSAKVVAAFVLGIGVVFIVLGFLTKIYPVPATVTALVIYSALLALNLINVASNAQQVVSLIIPVLIEIALIRSVRSAVAYQRELNASRSMADPLS